MYTLNNKNVKSFDNGGAIRCDGTVSILVILKDGTELDISGLTLVQEKALIKVLKSKKEQSVNIDPMMLLSSDELHAKHFDVWARRNGINY